MVLVQAADVFELLFSGYPAGVLPLFVVPLDHQVFMILTAFSHWWTIYLHNHSAGDR
jgi:hypothetical protein